MSYADKWTDKQLESLEKRIAEVYSEAQKDLEKTAKDYFDKFAERDEKELARLENGEITKQQYQQWRLAQIGRGERFDKLASEMAHRATATNEVAVAYVNDITPSIYTLNYNHEAYMIEKLGFDMKVGEEFTLINEQTVKRMIVDNPDVMPYYPPARAVKRGIDLEYGQKYIKKHVTSGILQGKGVGKIADDLQRDLTNMNRASALRTARTAITSAQNGGRQATMERAVEMGIPIRKKWKCTHDSHTRHEHGQADGQTVPVDEPFIVGGEKLMHPGDTSGSGWNIYNCRCVEGSVEKEGIIAEKRQMRVRNPETGENELVSEMTYEEWVKQKGTKPKANLIESFLNDTIQKKENVRVEDLDSNLQKVLYDYTNGKYGDICDYSQYVENPTAVRSGQEWFEKHILPDIDEKTRKDAVDIMTVIKNQPTSNITLSRFEKRVHNVDVGDTLDFGIRSATKDMDFSEKVYKGLVEGFDEIENTGEYIEYVFISSKHLDVSSISAYKAQEEVLVCGKYKVIKIEDIEAKPDIVSKSLTFKEYAEIQNIHCDPFVSKSGKEMVKYVENGVVKTMDVRKFETEKRTYEIKQQGQFGRKKVFLVVEE